MKSLKYRLKKQEVTITNTDWNKYDDRLMKAVERSEVDKVAAVLSKKGIIPTKLDVEGRSAFHLSATRGHLDCLNLILCHGVDVTATDAAGKNALHLAARNGHSLCVQKLLQHNCPVGNLDLQGRTALHDAVMAGCCSSVKLLCDSGAAVNACDLDGRTPLVLATQMCRPQICQLLLERGADIGIRDKQSKTALILGCEYSCKEAVEVLLRAGADVAAVDCFGHDSLYYARICKNPDLVTLIRNAVESAAKAKAAKMEKLRRLSMEMTAEAEASIRDQIIHDLERKFLQEQRALLDKVNLLQQQLGQEKMAVEDLKKEREELKLTLLGREKDEGSRSGDTVKVQLKSRLGDYSGQSVIKGKDMLVKQSHSLDSAQILQSPTPLHSLSRPLDFLLAGSVPGGEVEALREDLEATRKRQESAEQEVSRLRAALDCKSREFEELARDRDAEKRNSERQVQELEQALSDVQKRMLDSEAKVKQLQTHVVAMKEHLNSQVVDDLRAQLKDVKGKYEGASTEVGRLRNHLKQSEKALEEYKKSEGLLADESENLTKELEKSKVEREEMTLTLMDMESLMKEMEVRQASMVLGEKFDNMKNLLTNAVDEKEKQLAELREDYDRVLEEVAELHRELDGQKTNAERTILLQEHEKVRVALEDQNVALKKKLADVTSKSQALIWEVEEGEKEKGILRGRVQDLTKKMQAQFVPLKSHEDMKRSLNHTIEDLSRQLAEGEQKRSRDEAELQKLEFERSTLCENVNNLQSQYVPREKFNQEVGSLISRKEDTEKELAEVRTKCQDKEKELEKVVADYTSLKQSLEGEYVPRAEHERVKTELSAALGEMKAGSCDLEKRVKEGEEELRRAKERSEMLSKKLQGAQTTLEKDYVSFKEYEEMRSRLAGEVSEVERRAKEAQVKYQCAQEEIERLHKEMEEQKRELDMIQEAIQSRFVSKTVIEEKEKSFKSTLKDLTEQLEEMRERYSHVEKEGECHKQEKEKLQVEMKSVQGRLEMGFVPTEKYQEVEGRMKELSQALQDVQQQHQDVTMQKNKLEEQTAERDAAIQALQRKMDTEYVPSEKFEAMQQSLRGTLQQVQQECEHVSEAYRHEMGRANALEEGLKAHSQDTALLTELLTCKEALQQEVAKLRLALREEQESSAQKADDVTSLQGELLRATQALEELQSQGTSEMAVVHAEKQRFEEKAVGLEEQLSSLTRQCEDLYREAVQAKEGESRARSETETFQVKSLSIENEIKELKKRYDDSLSTIEDLQKRIQTSSEQTEIKDKKITELLTDVERLKQALNRLSQLAYAGSTPNKRQTQHVDTLQAQIKGLQQQLADAERQHREVVSIYRTHLLSAAQGHMDADVQAALLQIIRMRQQFVC
ncbi:uveal autoantigen with coiled-coil domains and ankyrin repeats protein-like isoform X1 [Brienomyrus brachyistius]|uniref:uveal autoantigen with coiled-coil domains and ankyrin repeats protein-like isoform X1 n=1 Tax=Brienomyrus brachyistius TaxID=42636 RepID=UPI0020B1D3BD|nr:uveal autoantigen with coiled-coil domains and ankyrin repeats protein-like isoform X1 [Brienomyrus brachyistius]